MRSVLIPLYGTLVLLLVAVAWAGQRRRSVAAVLGPLPASGPAPAATVALAGVELRRLVRHPLPWAGVLLTVALFLGDDEQLDAAWVLLGTGLWLFLSAALVTLHLAVSREDRAGATELLTTLPVGSSSRTGGHQLAAIAVASVVALIWSLFLLTVMDVTQPRTIGDFAGDVAWRASLLELAQPVLILAFVCCLGVAVGRWWPHPAAGPVVAALLLFSPLMWAVPLTLVGGTHRHYETGAFLGVIGPPELAWHLVFLVGATVLALVGAHLYDRRSPWLRTIAAIAATALVAGAALRLPDWWGT